LTGILLIIIFFPLIAYGSEFSFFVLALLVISVGLYELYSIVLPDNYKIEKIGAISYSLLVALIVYRGSFFYLLPLLTSIALIIFILSLVKFKELSEVLPVFFKLIGGIFYLAFFLSHFILIRKVDLGREWVFFLLAVVFLGDTAAFYGGSLFGKHKLYRAISPKKTLEGSLGGVIGSIWGALIFRSLFFPRLEIHHCLILSIGLAVMGQLGDLCESMIKRKADVKDSSKLLPGHGGLLDRIDGVIFGAPLLYYYLEFIM
jgi:phosphatidate cytidylyltransferase